MVRRDGNPSIIVSTNSHIYHDKSGQPLGIEGVLLLTSRHVNERKRIAGIGEKKYRILVENQNEGVFVRSGGNNRISQSRNSGNFGYGQEEMISKLFTEFIHPDEMEMVLESHFRRDWLAMNFPAVILSGY